MARLQGLALEQRILIYAGGWYGNAIMFVPPINIGKEELAAGLQTVAGLIEQEVER